MSQQRVASVVADMVSRINAAAVEHQVTYAEYRAAKDYFIRVGAAGEWPLFLDVFFESTVETLNATGVGSTIEGPYYVSGAPVLEPPYALPQRADEPGDVLIVSGTVRTAGGAPLAGALVDMWQADAAGNYSNVQTTPPEYNLRGKMTTGESGEFEVRTILPPSYHLPRGGPMEELLNAAGWHDWRPGHLHFIISADGCRPLTTQLYFEGDQWLDADVATAVKPELILGLRKHDDSADIAARGLSKPYFSTAHEFRLASEGP